MKCLIYGSENDCASHNLAVEEFLFGLADRSGCAIFYLWQNEKAVILGRNMRNPDRLLPIVVGGYCFFMETALDCTAGNFKQDFRFIEEILLSRNVICKI